MDAARILDGLNPEQRAAVEAVRGPVCIVAGAGSGKTTTITRRIAYQVASGTFEPSEILAVTFTDKAAGEMRSRLASLGVAGVEARTFHSAALAVLRGLAPDPPGNVLPSKVVTLRHIANALPKPFRFRPAADLATEIERAKNRRIGPAQYRRSLDGHKPPIPPDLMERVYREYELRKSERGLVDFEDMLELAVRLLEGDASARERFQSRFRAFTVDEYQDVNLLQQTLLELWLGEREDLCVVGDDYQSIYAFTGATPSYLLTMRGRRFPAGGELPLEPAGARARQPARPTARRGGEDAACGSPGRPGAGRARVRGARGRDGILGRAASCPAARRRGLRADGRSLPDECALGGVRGSARGRGNPVPRPRGWVPRACGRAPVAAHAPPLDLHGGRLHGAQACRGARALGRSRPRAWASTSSRASRISRGSSAWRRSSTTACRTVAEFVTVLEQRLADGSEEEGVNLLTYHRAKGLEFEAVFLPRLERNELPVRQAKTDDAVTEERRLLYVGMTRAKRHLILTRAGRASPFLAELGIEGSSEPAAKPDEAELPPVYRALKEWRLSRARSDGVPAYVVFHDRTLAEIATRRPETAAELAGVSGVGPAKLERYGTEVLATLAGSA